jgi:hypothetical protein
MQGHLEVVRLLISEGAGKEKATSSGRYPLLIACQEGHVEVARLLLSEGAPDKENATSNGYLHPPLDRMHGGTRRMFPPTSTWEGSASALVRSYFFIKVQSYALHSDLLYQYHGCTKKYHQQRQRLLEAGWNSSSAPK